MKLMFGRIARLIPPFLLACACSLLFSGCPSAPKPTPQITTLEPIRPRGNFVAPPIDSPVQTIVVSPAVDTPALTRDLPDAVLPEEKLHLTGSKVPLSNWATLCGFSEVRSVPNGNSPIFELTSPNGTLVLNVGQRFAKWNGINLGLGFPPMTERGQVVVHSLDILKNFYPLALGTLTVPKQTRVLVLDPGHGGADPGSRATSRKAFEKDLALDWALRIERLLANSSWRVILTRREDRDIPLMDRVAVADANQADLFISLHFNSIDNSSSGRTPDETGIETYCLTPAGAPSNVTRNYEDDLRRVYPNNEFDAQNLLLASRMQASLISATGRKDRGVRRARFMTVVREQRRPAVLVEGGFLSNPSEVHQLVQAEVRDQMARAVCNALPE